MQSTQKINHHESADNTLLDGLILPEEGYCFHCGDPVPEPPFYSEILGAKRQMCCLGCQLASQSIVEAGLEQYYLDRSEINRTASLPPELTRLQAYDHDDIKSQFVYQQEGKSVAELSVNNLRCAACTWLIESRLDELPGISQCQVNLTNQRMRVIWDESQLPISQILATVSEIGYEAKPYRQDTHEAMLARHNKKMLLRLGIAALGAMQSMMFAVALYFGEYGEMLVLQRDFLRWVSLFVSVPVFFYAGIPFFTSAWSAIRIRQVNMDVPVSIALIVTFFASLYATITGQGQTYYDSVSMFIFFLLAGRYIEYNARLKAASMANDLVVIEPVLVERLGHDNEAASQVLLALKDHQTDRAFLHSQIPAEIRQLTVSVAHKLNRQYLQQQSLVDSNSSWTQAELAQTNETASNNAMVTAQSVKVGDIVLVASGSEIISDGILISETATVSQSLLTGEGDLIVKHQGDYIVGGSQNDSQPFYMLVTALAQDSQIGLIDRLMNRALSEKPKIAEKADELARWFVARILVLSVVVFAGWYWVDPSQAIWATVAVLVATCPCALSLATPIALTVATNRLASYGFLTTRGHTIQTLAEITHVAFDKTGTLTYGKPNLLNIQVLKAKDQLSDTLSQSNKQIEEQLLAIAASLEVGSRHPVAHALLTAAYHLHLPVSSGRQHYPAGGVEAQVITDEGNHCYRIGHYEFATDSQDKAAEFQDSIQNQYPRPDLAAHRASSAVVLSVKIDPASNIQAVNLGDMDANDTGIYWQPIAYFYFNDSVRETAKALIDNLKAHQLQPVMLTGDPSPQALVLAEELGIDQAFNGLSPADKVTHIQRLQNQGSRVLMVGDGINDAPVLAAADVSSSIAGAADLAQVSSDSIILNGHIEAIADAKRIADKTGTIIKQNFRWALIYNSVILIPAAFGYVPPWLAAIGMSLSSLLVVLNALRLKRS